MILWEHLRLSWRLPDLLEEGLEPREAARLRQHVARCGSCARRLRRMERADALLARMPRMLFPLEAAAEGRAGHRLTTLAQWGAPEVERSAPYGPWPAAGAMAMAALVLALSVTAPDWGTVIEVDVSGSTTVASVMPDSSFYPMTLR